MDNLDIRTEGTPGRTSSGSATEQPEATGPLPQGPQTQQAPHGQRIEPLSACAGQPQTPEDIDSVLELQICPEPFEPLQVLGRWQRQLAQRPQGSPAAESHFIGRVRGVDAAGAPLQALELEHYPGMTEAQITAMARASGSRHGVAAVLVWHRVGLVLPGDAIVLVAVAAERRGPAQRACGELLEALKHEAPFWKRELRADGSGSWVQGNTPL